MFACADVKQSKFGTSCLLGLPEPRTSNFPWISALNAGNICGSGFGAHYKNWDYSAFSVWLQSTIFKCQSICGSARLEIAVCRGWLSVTRWQLWYRTINFSFIVLHKVSLAAQDAKNTVVSCRYLRRGWLSPSFAVPVSRGYMCLL